MRPTIISHRLRGYGARDSSLTALEAALKSGVQHFEIDTRVTADGVILIRHDRSIRRANGQWRPIEALTFSDVRALDSGIATLEAFLDGFLALNPGPAVSFMLDLKSSRGVAEHLQILKQRDLLKRATIISWRPSVLAEAIRAKTGVGLGLNQICVEPSLWNRCVGTLLRATFIRHLAGRLVGLFAPTIGHDLRSADIRICTTVGLDEAASDRDTVIISLGPLHGALIDALAQSGGFVSMPLATSEKFVRDYQSRGVRVALFSAQTKRAFASAAAAHPDYLFVDDPACVSVEPGRISEADSERNVATQPFSWLRLLPLMGLLVGLALFFALDLQRFISKEWFEVHQQRLLAFVHEHPWTGPAFAALLALIVACSIPIAPYVSIAAGYFFGTATAVPYIMLGVVTGCSVAYFAAKIGLGDQLRGHYGPTLKGMENGLRKNALTYLLALRLVPLVPFSVVNLGSALFGVPFWKFLVATIVGFLPAAILYAILGHQLSELLARGGNVLMRPEFLYPLIALAVLTFMPLIVRKL